MSDKTHPADDAPALLKVRARPLAGGPLGYRRAGYLWSNGGEWTLVQVARNDDDRAIGAIDENGTVTLGPGAVTQLRADENLEAHGAETPVTATERDHARSWDIKQAAT